MNMGQIRAWIAGCLTGGLIAAASAGTALAETRLVVVELFTSQGCSSCPPADAFLHELSQRDDVIALALHVDYWDYIGWKDSFAQPAFTQRQKAYAKTAGRRSVYTPQMIVSGQDHVVGTHEQDAKSLIKRHADVQTGVRVALERAQDGQLLIRGDAGQGVAGPLVVHLVRYIPSQRVEITRGENAGRQMDYANVVTEWSTIGEWDLSGPLQIKAPAAGSQPAVVILQRKGAGPILAAARLR
jgi:hypothetical protein